MFRQRFLVLGIVVMVGTLAVPFAAAQTTLYVNDDATGANDGSTWTDAFVDLQDALAAAASGDQIWVAAGTYRPDAGSGDRLATFQLVSGVTVYGGFDGTETTLEARAGLFDQTGLTGDLAGDDEPAVCIEDSPECDDAGGRCLGGFCVAHRNIAENSYHVVTGSGTGDSTVLDGFTITGGNANLQPDDDNGGGMYIGSGSPSVANCLFIRNVGVTGGGLACRFIDAGPIVTACTFRENAALSGGGGVYMNAGSPEFQDCEFVRNAAVSWVGGGVYNVGGDPVFERCVFDQNEAQYGGGLETTQSGTASLTDCTFTDNTAVQLGGGLGHAAEGDLTLVNCTFVHNEASEGGGVCCRFSPAATFTNCVFTDNAATIKGGGLLAVASLTALNNCAFTRNSVSQWGGAAYASDSSVTFNNCTLSDNLSGISGGGLQNETGNTSFTDCILWGNSDAGGMDESAQIHIDSGTVTAGYSCVGDDDPSDGNIYPGTGNIDDDPLFVGGPMGCYYSSQTAAGQVQDSPCVDAGSDTAANLGLDVLTTRSDEVPDGGLVDLGYHYVEYDGTAPDCNGNGIADECDVAGETSDDCDSNGIPDECQPDCNDNGFPDVCELPPFGTGPDCNENGVPDWCDVADETSEDCNDNYMPDECEPGGLEDCNVNGVPDLCDIHLETSGDCNENTIPDDCDVDPSDPDGDGEVSRDYDGNGTPDECECFASWPPEPDRLDLPGNPVSRKIRYVSFSVSDAARFRAVRVTFQDLQSMYAHWNGVQLYVQEPEVYCENAGTSQQTPCPDDAGGLPQNWFWGATVGCDPWFGDWTQYDVVHVYHEGINHSGVYDIQVIDAGCSPAEEGDYSTPLTQTTSPWADSISNCTTFPCGPADGITGIVDVTAILDKWKNLPGNLQKVRADIEGSPGGDYFVPDQAIHITDVTACLSAFLGDSYAPGWLGLPPPPPSCP